MKYQHEVANNVVQLSLEGDLIGEDNGASLIELSSDYISKGNTKCLINIEKVRYINSSGIGVLITLLTKFRNKGGEVVLVKPSENVEKLLIITKLTAIFSIASSVEEGLTLLQEK